MLDALKGFHDYDEDGPFMCDICASDSAHFVFVSPEDNEGKYHCLNCGCEYMFVGTEYRDTGDLVILKGEKRDWEKHLREVLTFPFEGYIHEYQSRGPFKQGDAVIINGIEFEDDHYGLIASIDLPVKNEKPSFFEKKRMAVSAIPLADVSAKDKDSKNYKELHDYSVWFTNLRDCYE